MAALSSCDCAHKILRGDPRGLPELMDALEREGDPRFHILGQRLSSAMDTIRRSQGDGGVTVAEWQATCLFAVRLVLSPLAGDLARVSL